MENEMQNNTENSPLIPPVIQGRSADYATGLKELYLNLKRGRRTTSLVANCSKTNWCATASKPSFKIEL